MFGFDVQLQEISQNLKTIIDNIDEGIHVTDADGRLVFVNEVARNLFHAGSFDAVGKHIMEVFTENRSKGEALLESLRTGRVVVESGETLFRSDGSIQTIVSTNIPVKLGSRIIGAIKISRDDTVMMELTQKIVELQTGLYKSSEMKKSETSETKETKLSSPAGLEAIVGGSAAITQLKRDLQKIAAVDEPVLLLGEPGVGQGLIARVIHAQSNSERRHGPFIYQSIRAVPKHMVEELLFGKLPSAGEIDGHGGRGWQGIIDLADGGTLFLSDIDAIPEELLARLITAIRERRIYRGGGTMPKGVDVRFIVGMSIAPALAGDNGGAYGDLYKKFCLMIGAIPLSIPALRGRKEDIPYLVAHFISEFNNRFGKRFRGITGSVDAVFQNYDWPGNVRELKHTIERAMIFFEDDLIRLEHLPPNLRRVADKLGLSEKGQPETASSISIRPILIPGRAKSTRPLRVALESLEVEMVNEAIKKAGGNISKAAKLLGIPRQTLQYRLKKYSKKSNAGDKTG